MEATEYKGICLHSYGKRGLIRFMYNGEFYYAGSLLSAKRFVTKLLNGSK